MDRNTAIRYFNGLARALGPDNLGMPVDAAAQALNLGLAGVGYAGHKTGLLKEPLPLVEKPVGGSDWIAEKLGNADDGSGEYTAGRLTPLVVGLARAGGAGLTKLMDKMLTQGPAAQGRAAQRGAIRVSRGPGDQPDPELVLSTSLNQELLPQLMTKGGNAELYSPSMGIKRGQVMTEFGDLALIPKLGAFDPATSPSTLFNRDAYTARWQHFDGRAAKDALRAPDLAKHARSRMHDRAVPFARPEDLRMNEGGLLGIPQKNDPFGGGYGGFWHDLSMETSPAFRSFQAYERNPLGAGLLRGDYGTQNLFQRKVREKGFGDQFGWLNPSAQQEAVQLVPRGPGELRDILAGEDTGSAGIGDALRGDFIRNGFTTEQMLAAAPELYKAAALVRRGIQHTPSDYAELKVLGSVPINADTFAGAMVQHGAMPETERILKYLGLPVIEKVHSWTPEQELEAITALQRGLAAPRQPAK